MSWQATVELRDRIRSCTACALRQRATQPVPWSGATPARYAIVGMAPGYHEDIEGAPFVGPAGNLLRPLLKKSGFPMHDIAYLNPVCCFPGRGKGGDNRPAPDHLIACRQNLLGQIDLLQPRYLILLGATALEAFRPDLELKYMHGRPMYIPGRTKRIDAWVTYHPAAALRSPKFEIMLIDDLAAFWDWRRTGEHFPEDCLKCHRPLHAYDEYGIATCQQHSARQMSLI